VGFYMRFVLINENKTTFRQIARGLKKLDPKYCFEGEEYFIYDNELYGQVEINRPDDSFFDDDISLLKERVFSYSYHLNAARILSVLEQAIAIFFVNVVWSGSDTEDTLDKFEPLWEWFFANREGILFVDENGFYGKDGILLSFAAEESK
jgi:hypothetical protein